MHDSTASSFVGSEDGSPSCSSSDEFEYRMPSVLSSQCAGNSTLFFTEGLYPNNEMLAGPPYGCGSKEYIIDLMFLESGSGGVGAKLSEARMAARRAEEAGQRVDAIRNAKLTMNSDNLQDSSSRRQQAAQWLQTMVGNLSLPANPTVEDLRVYLKNGHVLCKVINKVQPGSVPKVEDPSNPSQLDGALPNYLYYDNVRNFLGAVEDMGLPAFEASALEQGPMSSNASAKVVDCILALKSYHDWKQGGALGFWRLKSPTGSGSCVTSSRYSNHSKNINICSNNSRRKWMLSDQESLDGTSLSSSPDQSANFLSFHKDNRASFDDIMRLDQSGQDGVDGKSDEPSLSPETSASTSTWLQDIRHKFSEVLQVKAKRAQDALTATPVITEGYGGGATMTYDHNAPSQSLLSLISAIIGDKPAEEVPMLVEFMLRKIMEEFERHLLNQRNQVTKAINPSLSIAKMKTALKDIMAREEKLASQNMVLEASAAGTQEEIKNAEEEKRLKEEEVDNDKRMTIQDSKHQMDNTKHLDDKRVLHFESAKMDMEMESKERVSSLQSQLTESYKKMQEMEHQSSRLKAALKEKDDKYQKGLSKLLKEFKDLRWKTLDAKEEILRVQFDWKDQLKNFGEELQTLVAAASGYHKVLAENRQLYNEVQDLKGNIRVYCRVRPFLTKDSTKQTTIDYIGENGELVLANPGKPVGKDSRRSFTFNRCFDTKSLQEEVFLDTQPLIRSVLDGFNVCIFAYGQTGSGKTFTMSGPTNMTPTNWGVNYRALNDLFQITQGRVHVFRYEIGVQMLEIYNEQVRDLLVTDGSHKKLEIRNNSQLNGLNVPDANIMPVTSTDDVLELMKLGQKNRAVGSTSLNDRSSRSHSVVTVHVQGKDLESGSIFRGSLHLVDLAGSERVDKSEVTGDRLKEAQHINKSLSALGDVISALAQKNGHVPYRNSKLTQLLQDSLGGQAKTLMFVHISPDADSFGETMSTLKFAERVATVELGAARSNKESGEIQILKDQVHQLKEVVAKKDAEIAILNHTIKEQLEKADNTEKTKGNKPTNASNKPRRRTSNEAQAQKGRKTTTENGNGNANANANAETRQSMRKTPGGKKTPTSLVLSTGHDAEDSTEHFESSSACSPLDSPTENNVQFEVSEDGAVNVFEKLKLLKSRRKGIGKHVVGSFDSHHSFLEHDDSDVSEYVKAKPLNATTQQEAPGLLVFDANTPASPEGCQELNDDAFPPPGDDTRLSSFQDYTKPDSNGRYVAGANIKSDTDVGRSNQPTGLRLRPAPSNIVYSQEPANGTFETVLLDAIGGDAQDVGCKRSSFLLNSDVGLDEDFGDEEAFESRGTCQDDTASLYSDSGMSAEADNSGSSQVDQNKKVRSNSSRPQKGVLQSEVSLTPVTSSTSRTSPRKVDRKSTGGLIQVRPRKHKTAGPAATSDKPPPKRTAQLTGNANQEVDLASSRRSSIGGTSLTTWR